MIKGMLPPRNFKQLRMFLGIVSYCRQWIPHASALMQPLYDCLKIVPYMLTEVAYESFVTLKRLLISAGYWYSRLHQDILFVHC